MISRSLYRYRSVATDQTPLRTRIKEIAAARVRYGYKRVYVVLRREGWRINHKRCTDCTRKKGCRCSSAGRGDTDRRHTVPRRGGQYR
jgi:putative transposase